VRKLLIDCSDNNDRFGTTIFSLIEKPRSTSASPCEIIRMFFTSLDNVGYFRRPYFVVIAKHYSNNSQFFDK
jgi:hypothetical protein